MKILKKSKVHFEEATENLKLCRRSYGISYKF